VRLYWSPVPTVKYRAATIPDLFETGLRFVDGAAPPAVVLVGCRVLPLPAGGRTFSPHHALVPRAACGLHAFWPATPDACLPMPAACHSATVLIYCGHVTVCDTAYGFHRVCYFSGCARLRCLGSCHAAWVLLDGDGFYCFVHVTFDRFAFWH